MGTSRRVGMTLGTSPQVVQSFLDGGNCTGLDRFGRVKDLHYQIGTGLDHQYQYGYDKSGNRTHARVTQSTVPGTPPVPHDNDRSYRYAYDDLQRLTNAHMGQLNTANTAIEDSTSVPLARELTWTLDNLGNWVGDPSANPVIPGLGRLDDTNGDGTTDFTNTMTHAVDGFNGIMSVTADANPAVSYILDANGNLVYDGEYVYQYDAWNRLIAINSRGSLDPGDFVDETGDPEDLGKILPDPSDTPLHEIGELIYRFRYDGLGRLIVREQYTVSPPTAPVVYKKIHYYYDGVRIVQEVIETPGEGANPSTFHTEREYVYGPDYVDEFVAQIDDPGAEIAPKPSYMLQDANFNVMALVTFPETGGPVVLSQYQYEPYGPVAAEDHDAGVSNANENVAGHQGLFFHRLSVGGLSLAPGTQGIYYNRNRWYAPHLGRFLTRDPNGSGRPDIVLPSHGGEVASVDIERFSDSGQFADGISLYQYACSTPLLVSDPMGLFSFLENESAVSTGASLYSTYSTAQSLVGKIRDFASGVSLRNILLDTSLELASNYAGGKLLDKLVDVAGPLMNTVGQALRKATGRSRNLLDKHHAFPRFLGGWDNGNLVGVSAKVHSKFHSLLRAKLKAKGLKPKGRGSIDDWRELLEEGNNYDKAIEALREASKEMDASLGGNVFTEALLDQLKQQGF